MRRLVFAIAMLGMAAGCESYVDSNPVIFGQTQNVGLNIGLSQVNQTPELSLGYRDFNIAILPTVARQKDENGTIIRVLGSSQQQAGAAQAAGNPAPPPGVPAGAGNDFGDTYSVLGQFDLEASSGQQARVGLGKFFTTGLAAQRLSDGFACALSQGTAWTCQGRSLWPGSPGSPAPAPAPAQP